MHRIVVALYFAASLFTALPAAAQDTYPSRPVRIIVGFGPASAADIVARVLAQRLGQSMHQQFVVETRPGAGSSIAAEYVARAPKSIQPRLKITKVDSAAIW